MPHWLESAGCPCPDRWTRGNRTTSSTERGTEMSSRSTRHRFLARPRRSSVALAAVVSLALAGTACSSSTSEPEPRPSSSPTVSAPVSELTLGMVGHADELAVHETMVSEFNAKNPSSKVTLQPWSNAAQGSAALNSESLPDVFLAQRSDLAGLLLDERIQPVSNLLDERGVDFGDRFSRTALQAFGADNVLQCMPYGISPQVVFYNTDLIDDEVMVQRGLSVPTRTDRWTFAQFEEAARFAARPKRRIRGFAVEPTVLGIAPFLLSGGGSLFNEDEAPSSLAFSEDASKESLTESLPVLRDPMLSLSAEQSAKRSSVDWFKRGKVAMIMGTRDLVPELRQVEGLNFDVRAMPTLEQSATVGSLTALCMSADTTDRNAAADLIVDMVSDEQVTRVAELGRLVPANLAVAGSAVVQEVDTVPANSAVFVSSLRNLAVQPLILDWPALAEAVNPLVADLLLSEPTLDLGLITEQIDAASRTVLAADDPTPSPSPSPSPLEK